jgi:SMI1-KNR4 cell-wall
VVKKNMEEKIFKDFDFTNFWSDREYALKEYQEEYPTDEIIDSIEEELGYKLPMSYIELMRLRNGGIPINSCFPTTTCTTWAEDHIAITAILGIGRTKNYSWCGRIGSKYMMDEWGYPDIGVCICDCPSARHDMVMLDYSQCGREGEPEVVHIDQEWAYRKTFLAKDFETFIRGLVSEDEFDLG